MATRRKKPTTLEAVAPTCGACTFCTKHVDWQECRRYPPQVMHDTELNEPYTSFPVVETTDAACGEFKPKQ